MRSQQDMDMLKAAVESKVVPIYASNYGQVKDMLKDKHGEKGWIGAMAQAVSGSEKRSGKEYLRVRRSIERNETGQYKKTKYAAEMKRIGQTLPPIGRKLPGDKITLTVKGKQDDYSKRPERNITVTFKGPDAYSFADSPNYRDIWDAYHVDPDDFEEGSGALEVTSVA